MWHLLLLLLASTALRPAVADLARVSLDQPHQVASGLLPGDLAARYQVYRVNALPSGQGLRWVFAPRGETAELYSAGSPLFPAGTYRATVSLDNDRPAVAALGCQGYDNAWQAGETQPLAKRKPVTLTVAPGPGGARRLALRLSNLEPGAKYVVDWRSLEGQAGPAEVLPAPPPAPSAPAEFTRGAVLLDTETLEPDYTPPTGGPEHLYRLPAPCAFSPYGQGADVWLAEGKYDYRDLNARLAALVARDPAAQVLLQVTVDSPPWWEAQHPETLVPSPKSPPDLTAERKLTHASWYSSAWRVAARQALVSLVTHVQGSVWAERVVGYELDSGRAGRWVPWHQAPEFQETSVFAQVAFRTWLQRKYGSLGALRVAWGQPRQPLMDSPEVKAGFIFTQWVQIKPPAARYMLDPKSPTLYEPSGQQHLADYQQFLGEYTAQTILDLVQAGREVTGPERLWGACYGHLLWWPAGDWPPSLAGHLGLGKLLAAEEINFLVGPPGATQSPTAPVNSIGLRSKRYLEQPSEDAKIVRTVSGHGPTIFRTSAQAQATTVYNRSESNTIPAGPPPWALVLDERSLAHLSPGTDLQRVTLQSQAGEMQAQYWPDTWLTGDLPATGGGYGGYVMAATYYVSEELREAIIRRTRPGTVVVWLYAAGALDGGFIDPSAIFRLTGLKATMPNSAGSLRIEVPPGEPFFTPEADKPLQWGPQMPVQPRFVLVTGEDTVGTMQGSNWPGLGLRRDKDALTVYSAAPGIPGEALRRLAEETARRAGITYGGKPGVEH